MGLEELCGNVCEGVAEPNGFVAVRKLAEHFAIPVIFRPLLVEAMIGTIETKVNCETKSKLVVLIDQEAFGSNQQSFDRECPANPLPERLRNTLAHELLHSLSFRSTESSQELLLNRRKRERHDDFLRRVENETERLSPLLLVPGRILNRISEVANFVAADLEMFRELCCVSRDVFINRIGLLSSFDPERLRYTSSFRNTVIGVGEWIDSRTARFLTWPLFLNFDNGIVPSFVEELQSSRSVLASNVVDDSDFVLNGGTRLTAVFRGHRDAEPLEYKRMDVSLSVGENAKTKKGRFLFVARKQ